MENHDEITDELTDKTPPVPENYESEADAIVVEPSEEEETAEARAERYLDQLKRAQADFENYRKRIVREKSTLADVAKRDLLARFLELYDALGSALQHPAKVPPDAQPYVKGMQLLNQRFLSLLEQEGVRQIKAEGAKFDPEYHEAVATVKGDVEDSGYVAREVRKGYLYKDVLLRPTKVVVYE
jgi:molecular chaperone GrpE